MTKVQFRISKSRSYSRKGCQECKRRKIKCDEGKPECWQCSRLNKPCKYSPSESVLPTPLIKPGNLGPINAQNTLEVSKSNKNHQELTQTSNTPTDRRSNGTISNIVNLVHIEPHTQSPVSQTSTNTNDDTSTVPPITPNVSSITNKPTVTSNPIEISPQDINTPSHNINSTPHSGNPTPPTKSLLYPDFPAIDFDYSDLSMLATDINSLVDNLMGESKHDLVDFPTFPLEQADGDSKSSPFFQIPSIKEGLSVFPSKNTIQLDNLHERIYLEEFQRVMINPYDIKLDATGTVINPFQEILLSAASREPYMLTAMLAHGAFCLLGYSDLPQDEQAFHHYLLKCLKHLAPSLTKVKDMDKQVQISVVESSMLTVLLLSTVHASFPNLDWRSHLRKAGEILIKLPQGRSTPTLHICKYWYMLIEVVAELSLNYGGTLKEDHELDSLICEGYPDEIASMKKYYIIEDLGFNFMFGFHNDCISLLRDLCKLSRKARSGKPCPSEECLRISTELFKFRKWCFLNTMGYISVEDAAKYKNSGRPHLFIACFRENEKDLCVSWLDISHQSYMIASQVTLLTRGFGLSGDSTIVQGLVDEYTKLYKYMVSSSLTALFYPVLMCQWPLYAIGMHCIKEKDRYSVMRYFRQLARFGIHSAKYLLKRLLRVWYPETQRTEEDDDNDTFAY